MRRTLILLALLGLILAACGGDNDDATAEPLPTLMVLGDPSPEVTPETTPEVDPTVTVQAASATDTAPATGIPPTATGTNSATPRPTATATPPPSATPSPDAAASRTAAAAEAPRFSTLTPQPGGASPQTPVVAADLVITEAQFQEELDTLMAGARDVEFVAVGFRGGDDAAVVVTMEASGGEALTTGTVIFSFQLSGDFVLIGVREIDMGSGDPPEPYVAIVSEVLRPAIVTAFDNILNQRLGPDHDLESLTITDTAMEIMLLVPE